MPTTDLRLGRHTPVRRRRRWIGRTLLVLLVVVVVIGALVGYRKVKEVIDGFGGPTCRGVALGQPVSFSPEQMANAATITAVAVGRHLPARAATIALATAIQESKLRNLTYGDADSVGLFQQRTSQGWGTTTQIMDPVHASNAFYDALVKIKGYQSMEITAVAQKVQKSAYPAAYAAHEQQGRVLASVLSGLSPGGMGCRLDPATTTGKPTALAAAVAGELKVTAKASGRTVAVTASSAQLAWAAGAWAVARSGPDAVTEVTVGDRTWTRAEGATAETWHPATTPTGSATSVRVVLH